VPPHLLLLLLLLLLTLKMFVTKEVLKKKSYETNYLRISKY